MDYLAKHQQRPLQSYLDMSEVCTEHIAVRANAYVNEVSHVSPENEAIWFYLQNHVMAELSRQYSKYEPLAPAAYELTSRYHRTETQSAMRMFFYLLLICTRETRHIKNLSEIGPVMTKKYKTGKLRKFTQLIKGTSSGTAVTRFYTEAPDVGLGKYTSYMYDLFNDGNWSSSFGGKKWADIAKVLRDFVLGTITAEMMMDTAFTLAHNCGPIFNKGLVFNCQNNQSLLELLDVQRSGQIPELVREANHDDVTTSHRDYLELADTALGNPFGGYVDWYKVDALGAMGSYEGKKAAQTNLHGVPEHIELAAKIETAKKAIEVQKYYTVMEGAKLNKLTREEL